MFSFSVTYGRRLSTVWFLMFNYLSIQVSLNICQWKMFIAIHSMKSIYTKQYHSLLSRIFLYLLRITQNLCTYPRFWNQSFVCEVIFWNLLFLLSRRLYFSGRSHVLCILHLILNTLNYLEYQILHFKLYLVYSYEDQMTVSGTVFIQIRYHTKVWFRNIVFT